MMGIEGAEGTESTEILTTEAAEDTETRTV
jgi:hypothetical protein